MSITSDINAAITPILSAADAKTIELNEKLTAALARIVELENEAPTTPPVTPPTTEPPVTPTPSGKYGVHFPSNTPRTGPIVEVDCNWPAIGTAIRNAQPETIIKVRPGTVSGYGFGATTQSVIPSMDKRVSGKKKILVVPRDGYGTVTVNAGVTFQSLFGVAFLGFNASGQGIHFVNSSDCAWGWGELDHARVTARQGAAVANIEWVEIVTREVDVRGDDRHRFVTAGAGSTLKNVSIIGGYTAPIYRPTGATSHTDFLQLEKQSGGGEITGIFVDDHIAWGASNQTIQSNGSQLTIRDTVLLGGRRGEKRYPRPANADLPDSSPRVINGAGRLTVEGDSVIVGIISANWQVSGNFRNSITDEELDRLWAEPTHAELAAAWIL
jgi:hypothetical protein